MMNRVLITGGPGTGKTSLINELKRNGYNCSEEIVRKITLTKRKEGHKQYFLSNPLDFSLQLFDQRLTQYNKKYDCDTIIYDRGPIDVLAYLDFKSILIPKNLIKKSKKLSYKYSFILNPWKEIYVNDDIRYETFEECKKIHSSPIKFNQVKNERYLKVIDRLKDIRNAQVAFKSVNGIYSSSFDELIKFVDSAQFTIVQKRDSSYMQYDRVYRIDMLREVIVIDTLGYVSVKDSLFSSNDSYKKMAYVPIDGVDEQFKLKADIIDKNGYNVPVFEVRVSKDLILFDQSRDLITQEKQTVSVDGVNGPDIVLGSLSDVSTNGNWPTTFDFERK